jgi:hypothetical protein
MSANDAVDGSSTRHVSAVDVGALKAPTIQRSYPCKRAITKSKTLCSGFDAATTDLDEVSSSPPACYLLPVLLLGAAAQHPFRQHAARNRQLAAMTDASHMICANRSRSAPASCGLKTFLDVSSGIETLAAASGRRHILPWTRVLTGRVAGEARWLRCHQSGRQVLASS